MRGGEGGLCLTGECRLTNAEGMTDIGHRYLAGRSQQWMLRLVGEVCWRSEYWRNTRVSFHKMLIEYKGEDGDLTVEKSGGRPLEWVIKVNVTRGGTGQHRGVPRLML